MLLSLRYTTILAVSLCLLSGEAGAAALVLPPHKVQAARMAEPVRENPFFVPSSLSYQAPRFDLITDADYAPAFEKGMEEHLREVQAIARNQTAPNFENTIVALEKSGRLLDRVQQTFYGVYQANSNAVLDKVQTDFAPRLTRHQDAVYLNEHLFARIKNLYGKKHSLKLNPEQAQLLDVYYQQFVHAGALLSKDDKNRLQELNIRISELETAYAQRLVAATRDGAMQIDELEELDGLDDGAIAAAEKVADERGLKGMWLFPLQNTIQQPALAFLKNRETRHDLFRRSWERAERGDDHDTRAIIAELAELRAKKAALFHYPNYAAYVLYDQMAQTPEAVDLFMKQLEPMILAEQKREAAALQEVIGQDDQKFTLQPWDWAYYVERMRREKYDLNDKEVRPYFDLHRVLEDGVFYAASQLYGISFVLRQDIPTYHPDVMVYEVKDQDGLPLGLMYFDYFKRDTKSGGAWMSSFVGQSKLLGTKPVIYNVANFTRAAPGQPQLISYDDVVTMFHEFGHALHGLFANQTYPSLSGTNVARDFVEFPSQFNENWALYPEVFAHYARHYKTGAPMPQALVAMIRKAERFNQGYALGEIMAAAELDMAWHSLSVEAPRQDVDAFEVKTLAGMGLDTKDVPPRYRSSTFLHIWGNGYSAGYYAYLWTEMLDQDAFSWFQQHGGLTRANGQRFRDMILSKGHTMDYGSMFRAFYGKDPDIAPMLEHRGLLQKTVH